MKLQKSAMVFGLAIELAFIHPAAPAQQAAAVPGIPVQIVVSAEPKKGNEIPMITRHDVMVHQGKDLRPVQAWVPATGNHAGLALAILIDDSSGFTLGTQLNDIRTFIQQQAATTTVAVGYMQNGQISLAQNFTLDHAAAAKSVRLAQGYFGINASPYLSLSTLISRLPSSPAVPRREVLMITSGIDTVYTGSYPDPYVDQAVRDAQCAGIVVYSIYTPSVGHFGHSFYRTYWSQNYLSELSEDTGGESYYLLGPQSPVSFAPYLDELNRQLPEQFLLTFLAEPRKKAGTEPVKVTSEYHSVDLLHASNVCVPAASEE